MSGKKTWTVIVTTVIVSMAWLALLFSAIWQSVNAHSIEAETQFHVMVEDRVAEEVDYIMPMHLQTDPQWSDISYSTGTIKSHGCGLCCLSMMVSCLTGEEVYPTDLVSHQDEFLQADVNNPDAMCKWASEAYGLEWSGERWSFNENIDKMLDAGYVVMCSMEGKLGESDYGGHVVLVYGMVNDGYIIRDPDNAENSVHVFTEEELSDVTWGSLNGLRV